MERIQEQGTSPPTRIGSRCRISEENLDAIHGRENEIQPPVESKPLHNESVSPRHWKLLEKSISELNRQKRTACDIFNEIVFDMRIQEEIGFNECGRCKNEKNFKLS